MLWIALHLPLLSLESFAATLALGGDEQAALALMDAHTILSVNSVARALGVKPGLKRATALALAPQLVLGQADAARDAQALVAVAHAALAFTPSVAIQPAGSATGASPASVDAAPHTVLLEVHASLRYFGGLAALLQRLHAALAPLGHLVHMVSASTPLGAALLARVHARLDCADLAATRRALEAAPVGLLGPGRDHWEALQGMGLHTLADLMRVPREGLARRFGEVVLDELDRALGTRPDPRVHVVLPPSFESRLELFARADTTEQLMHGAAVLLARLVAWLSAQHAFVRRFSLSMQHEKYARRALPTADATTLDIALTEPSRDQEHLRLLLRERLAALQLPAPTLELTLRADDIARRAPPNTELFPTAQSEQEGLTRLIERLQARLGPEQVMRLVSLQDHRPERASVWQREVGPLEHRQSQQAMRPGLARPGEAKRRSLKTRPEACAAVRPVWMLQHPEPLRESRIGPQFEGQRLNLLSGPERIEAGWWDDTTPTARRDYFIAQLPDGALLWIYRARPLLSDLADAWFLQGWFG